jgi:hypothetical protein
VPEIRTSPVIYVDADVRIDGQSVVKLVNQLKGGILAAAPGRHLDLSRASRLVRAYYNVWEQLPHVRNGLYGRGVIALTEEGQRRVAELPDHLSDDLAYSEVFAEHERAITGEAAVTVTTPTGIRDLVGRRTRVAVGNALYDSGHNPLRQRTDIGTIFRICRSRPATLTDLPVFVGVTVWARARARQRLRHGEVATWDRDESSRGL